MANHPLDAGERAWVAAPACADPNGLAAFLGIARAMDLPVDGFADAAVTAVAALGLERSTVVVELGMHHVAATAVDTEAAQARRRRSRVTRLRGLADLHQRWLEFIASTLVKRTRFDPLHDAATEQQLFDQLPALAAAATADGTCAAVLSRGTERREMALTRDQFAQAGEPVYHDMLTLLHGLRPAGAALAIVVPRAVAELPGLRPRLEDFAGCELVVVPDGFASAALSLLDLPPRDEDKPAVWLRRLPICIQPALLPQVARDSLGQQRVNGPTPSHILLEGRAYVLDDRALVVGRHPGTPHAITLEDGMAGVSRRHCTFVREGTALVLLDHSSNGTFVNGERVAERVSVHAGDRVRVGEPGIELTLIAVGEAGQPASTAPAAG
ncbi:MAG TPA: FHA domain-containing protein [Steroidobacteraceae bacterium]|nr:FHA domain-containing protein [Steroidobacteraceae bacterium]